MKFSSSLILLLLSCSFSTGGFSKEPEIKPIQEQRDGKHGPIALDRIPLGKKPSKHERKAIQKERRFLAKKQKKQAKRLGIQSPKSVEKCFGLFDSPYVQPLYRIKGIGATGRTLTFDNETIWELSSSFTDRAKSWTPGSYVVIVPNTRWFSSYTYQLENVSDKSSIPADLSEGPFKKYALYIEAIDRLSNKVSLTDGSFWQIASDSSSSSLFSNWKVGQAVLLGENRGWFGWTNGAIMININENNYIPSKRYR